MMFTHRVSVTPAPRRRARRLAALAAFVLLAAACRMQPSIDRAETDVQGDGFRIVHLGRANTSSLSYTIDVGSKKSDVYVVFTNPGGERLSAPALRTSTGVSGSAHSASASGSDDSPRASTSGGERGRGVSGTPLLRDVANSSRLTVSRGADSAEENTLRFTGEPDFSANSFEELYGLVSTSPSNRFDPVPACVVHSIEPAGSRHGVVVWAEVDGNNGSDCTVVGSMDTIDEDAAEEIAEAFVSTEDDEDIYTAVTDIFGTAWGDSPFGNVLPSGEEYIHIFLFDIAGAGDTLTEFIAGYFFANDTIVDEPYSNERLILYLHGPAYAKTDNGSDNWSITDEWPSIMTQTLAHEFQHLINWYQKSVARGALGRTEVWLDEMMSLLAEEYVGPLLKSRFDPGDDEPAAFSDPRGVPPLLLTSGDTENTSGRLPLFNYWNMQSILFGSIGGTLADYSASYAFGAWLTRNYGGVRLMRDILDNAYFDERAVTTAVRRHGRGGLNFGELLERWGASVVLSDRVIPVQGYRYRSANGFTSSTGDTEVTLGSIDLHNYLQDDNGTFSDAGPRYFTSSRTMIDEVGSTQPGYSNVYYKGPQGRTGSVDLEMSVSADTRVTIIIKEQIE